MPTLLLLTYHYDTIQTVCSIYFNIVHAFSSIGHCHIFDRFNTLFFLSWWTLHSVAHMLDRIPLCDFICPKSCSIFNVDVDMWRFFLTIHRNLFNCIQPCSCIFVHISISFHIIPHLGGDYRVAIWGEQIIRNKQKQACFIFLLVADVIYLSLAAIDLCSKHIRILSCGGCRCPWHPKLEPVFANISIYEYWMKIKKLKKNNGSG